jgi:hypothetical protein
VGAASNLSNAWTFYSASKEMFINLQSTSDVSYDRGSIPDALVTEIINQLKQYLTIADITVLSQALTTLSVLLRLYPRVTYTVIEGQILAIISSLVCSPMVAGAALNSTEEFYGTLVTADNQIASHVIPSLFTALDRAGREGSAANVSKCIARVVRSAMGIAAGTIAEFTKHVKVYLDSCSLHLSDKICSRARNLKKVRSYWVCSPLARSVVSCKLTNLQSDPPF